MRVFHFKISLTVVMLSVCVLSGARGAQAVPVDDPAALEAFFDALAQEPDYQQAVQYFAEVFKTMQEHYYQAVPLDDLKRFIYIFNVRIFPQLKVAGKSPEYIKWRSAAHLVEMLREEDDIFSMLFPPQDAVAYEKEVLGKRVDLGIDGDVTRQGLAVRWVEPRSDAYAKGLRPEDVIYEIDGRRVGGLSREEITTLLTPLEGEEVVLGYMERRTRRKKTMALVSREYFKKLAFMAPTGMEQRGIFCIRIERFNRATGEDVAEYIRTIGDHPGEIALIIDLRGNPGGPPLAAREIAGFFLEPGGEFAYFQRRGYPRSGLDIPPPLEAVRFEGDMVILIDQESGSASELFSGVLQRRGRAELMGTSSAGQVFLKSMYHLSDGSMVLLVTARGHHPDGQVFSFNGLTPDLPAAGAQGADGMIRHAARYLVEKRQKRLAGSAI
jgi:C-terminal peptidase prc